MLKNAVFAAFAAMILGVSGLAVDLQDFTQGKEKITRNGVDFWIEPNSAIKQDILNGKFDEVAKNFSEEASENKIQTRAVNPPLSKVHIYEVESSNGGVERIDYKQASTKKSHGGSVFKVKTMVTGFGCINDVAQFKNQAVKTSAFSFMVNVNKAYGCIDERDLSGKGVGGTFVFTARNSAGTPTKKITETLLIKY